MKKAVLGNEDIAVAITVGSETLYRGNFTGQDLLGRLSRTLSSCTALDLLLSLIVFSSIRSPPSASLLLEIRSQAQGFSTVASWCLSSPLLIRISIATRTTLRQDTPLSSQDRSERRSRYMLSLYLLALPCWPSWISQTTPRLSLDTSSIWS